VAGTGSVAAAWATARAAPVGKFQAKDLTMRSITISLAAALLMSGAPPAAAQQALPAACQSEHAGHMGTTTDTSGMTDMHKAYAAALDKMHAPMAAGVMAADPDVAFVCGMIPHHQGAIDMAKVVLEHGRDEQTRKWAHDVIREQQREITEMQEWLRKRARPAR
jgi:uncharacterized protein (DUF305 family)